MLPNMETEFGSLTKEVMYWFRINEYYTLKSFVTGSFLQNYNFNKIDVYIYIYIQVYIFSTFRLPTLDAE